jgi:hypothetical protein
MERRRLAVGEFPGFVLGLPFGVDLNRRYLGLDDATLVARIERDLLRANALRNEDGFLVAS